MITAETGLPGAGKTLYCVDKLLRPLVGAVCHYKDEHDQDQTAPRTIYSNINGLLLDHEKIGPGTPWTFDAKTETWIQPEDADKFGLNNWHEWAKPGSVIVYDEIQKPWPIAASGSRKPPCITALETHRHMGVDFIVMTQHPMLIHSGLVLMIARHLHVRRMGNMGLAIVYEWDSCSKTLLYKNAMSKSPYRYDKTVFELYKSAELHTKQPRRMPSLVWGILLALGAIGWFGPAAYGRISERVSPSAIVAKSPPPPAATPAGKTADTSTPGLIVETVENPLPPATPDILGCGQLRSVCRCYDKDGVHVTKPEAFCLARVTPAVAIVGPSKSQENTPPSSSVSTGSDEAVLEWMAKRR